jgi:hypothetical protein
MLREVVSCLRCSEYTLAVLLDYQNAEQGFSLKETSLLLSTLTAAWISRLSRFMHEMQSTTQRYYFPHLPELVMSGYSVAELLLLLIAFCGRDHAYP